MADEPMVGCRRAGDQQIVLESKMLGTRLVGPDQPVFVVAEIGQNHCGEIERALQLIKAAADAGADAVKLQKRAPKELLTSRAYQESYFNGGNSFGVTYGKHREALEFDVAAYRDLKAASEELGMYYFASIWDLPSVAIVEELDLPVVKVPSANLTDEPLIRALVETKKPLFVSTGMSKRDEIARSVELLQSLEAQFVLFHCVSLYPTPAEHAKLGTLRYFQETYHRLVGYSGHDLTIPISVAARSLGACVIEKHFTIDRSWKGSDQGISLLPHEFAQLVDDVRSVEKAILDGVREDFIEGEERQRKKLAKSIVARRNISAGEKISAEMVTCKCPGGGLSPQFLDKILGKRAKWNISVEEYILESHLEPTGKALNGASEHPDWGKSEARS